MLKNTLLKNFSYFIATKVATSSSSDGQRSFSRLIIQIAVVAVALSVAVMILTTALVRGFKNEIKEKMFGFFGHIQITDLDDLGASSIANDTPINLDQAFYTSLDTVQSVKYWDQYLLFGSPFGKEFVAETKGGIHHIQTYALKPGIIKSEDNLEGIVLKGIGEDFDWQFLQDYMVRGDTIETTAERPARQILISESTARRIQVDTGATFIINFVGQRNRIQRKFEVVGIYKTGLEEYDKVFAFVDIRQVQRLLGWDANQITGFEVFLDHIDDLHIITDYLYNDIIPTSLYAETIQQRLPAIFDWLELQNVNEIVIITLMLIVSIINMITALMILILERTNMIGTLKALGASNWSIRKIFLYYAAYIVGVGLLWGNLLGIGIGVLQDQFRFIRLSEVDYYLSYAPIELNFWSILLVNVFTLLIILLFLVIPSYLVTKINPVQAIRFK